MNSAKLAIIFATVLVVYGAALIFNFDAYKVFSVAAFILALDSQIVGAVRAAIEKEKQRQVDELFRELENKDVNKT